MVTSNQASNFLEIWKSEVRASMAAIPTDLLDLLERPLYAHLATTRPDGTVQVSPMWFDWDGERLRFSTTTTRQKYRNVQSHPHVAASISDPENPYRFLEVRGVVEEIEPDPSSPRRADHPVLHQDNDRPPQQAHGQSRSGGDRVSVGASAQQLGAAG